MLTSPIFRLSLIADILVVEVERGLEAHVLACDSQSMDLPPRHKQLQYDSQEGQALTDMIAMSDEVEDEYWYKLFRFLV